MVLASSITLPLPGINAPINTSALILQIAVTAPIVGGFLLARESHRTGWYFEIAAVVLLVIATAIPASFSGDVLKVITDTLAVRWPLMAFLLGLAWIRDGGIKIIPGVILAVVSGYIAIPH